MRDLALLAVMILAGCTVRTGTAYSTASFTSAAVAYDHDPPTVEIISADLEGVPITSIDVFFDQLDPYGAWYDDPTYGWAFVPSIAGYTPYSNGHWRYGDVGLVWVSYDPFGWATDHYGRWIFQTRWVWVPDTTWGPAWVTWREGDGSIGWAPCGFGSASYVPDDHWRFVSAEVLLSIDIRLHYVTRDLGRHVRDGRPIARYHRHGDHQWAAGPSEDWMRRNRLEPRRERIEPRDLGRFDRLRHQELERRAATRQHDWAARRDRDQQVRRTIDERLRRQRDEETRTVEDQRRQLSERRRIDEQRSAIERDRTRIRDDGDRRRIETQQRQLDEEQRRFEADQRARQRAEERARKEAEKQRQQELRQREEQRRDPQKFRRIEEQRRQAEQRRLEAEQRGDDQRTKDKRGKDRRVKDKSGPVKVKIKRGEKPRQ